MTALWWSIAVVLLACQLTVGEWTFSLRISSARCGRAGPCDGNILAMCLRHIGAVREDRGHSCYVFIAGEANELLERELTSLDQVNSTLMPDGSPFVNPYFSYRGGVQLYMAILTQPDIPPFKEDIVDEVFVDLERTMGGGECSVVDVVGLEGILSATVSFTVDCYTGYSGDNCSCSGNETCESTGATSNCDTTPTSTSSESPPATNSDATSTATESTATPSPSGSEPSIEQPTVGALNSTEASETSLLLPVAAAGGGVVVILGVLILVVTIILVYRRRRYRKMYRLNLSALTVKSPKLTPTIPPNDVVDNNGVTYSTVVHEDNTGYHNEGYGEEKVDLSKLSKSQSGLVYADLDHNSNNAGPPAEPGVQYVQVDHDRATYSTFRVPGHQKRKPPPPNTPIQYTTIRREQPHKYVNVPHPKPRSNLPRTEQNLYSTVPPGACIAPTNQ